VSTEQLSPQPIRGGSLLGDVWVIARRGLVHMKRQPEVLTDATVQPIMFVLLFAYVFGGAISVPDHGDYKEFLMGGIIAQTLVFACFGVAMGIAADRGNGAIDRFRSLPIAKGAVLGGHAVANLIKALLPIALMAIAGLIIGWAPHGSVTDTVAAFFLSIMFAFTMIWVGVLMGSTLSSPEAVQGFAFTVLFPFTFISSCFVPTSTLPSVLKTLSEWNPTSTLANSLRHLFHNPGGAIPDHGAFPLQHPVLYTVLWAIAIVAVFVPLSIRAYQRSIAD
jgi:ABC-type polysaccharide/polyol phosphate export permease